MKSIVLPFLAILALAAAGGTVYNLGNSGNPQKYLAWVDRRYDGLATRPAETSAAPGPADQAPSRPAAGEGSAPGSSKVPRPEAPAAAAPAVREFELIDLARAVEEFEGGSLFLDARRSREYEAGHIPGAHSLSAWEADLPDKVAKLLETEAAEAPVVLYCSNSKECEDSKIVARQLKQAGFLNLMIFSGGFPEWVKEKPTLVVKGKEPGERGKS